MKNLIKFLLIFIFITYNFTLKADGIEKVIFSIDTLSYTSIDLKFIVENLLILVLK